jgi:hypothetical protein
MVEFDDLINLETLWDGDTFLPTDSWANLGLSSLIRCWNWFVNVPIESPNYNWSRLGMCQMEAVVLYCPSDNLYAQ